METPKWPFKWLTACDPQSSPLPQPATWRNLAEVSTGHDVNIIRFQLRYPVAQEERPLAIAVFPRSLSSNTTGGWFFALGPTSNSQLVDFLFAESAILPRGLILTVGT